ncbi:cache domain-containing sensor histidine kinase [Paenibacillus cremeus]|uniref:Sensor histidine kinase n=1 Tax=Paenibacillus cremeus TaxID=2163881 RepID=A0A559KG62_9BACL|nr:sensor histidine kinase [Paenibacillus cremeus]TVY11111.1 sensor histidine kinase [Paenibacillus cremeus]
MKKTRLNLFVRLMLAFLSLIVLPLTIVSYFGYTVATEIINNNVSRSIKQTVHQLSLNSEVILEDAEKAVNTLLFDSYNKTNPVKEGIMAYDQATDYEKNVIAHNVEDELNKYAIYRNDINGLYLISTDGVIFSSANQLLDHTDFASYVWYQGFMAQSQVDVMWSPAHKVSGYTKSSNANVVTVLKKIKSPYGTLLGVLWMDLNERSLENVYTSGDVAPGGYTYILNSRNTVISASDKGLVSLRLARERDAMFANVFQEDNGHYFYQENGVQKLVAFATIHTTGWKMVTVIPVQELFVDAARVKNIILVLALITTITSTVIAYFVARRISKPVHNLIRLMEKASEGNLTVRAKVRDSDEFGKLNQHFNIMIGEIQNLISTVYLSNIKQKEAELASLEAQINPHFLYNTLQSIKWLSDIYKAPDIGDMAISLAKIFRFSIKGAPIVSLYEEMQHVKDYINIQRFRYGDRFELDCKIPEELLQCQIPKLIVQPLVENAIYHGIEMKEDSGLITIWAESGEECLHIGVEDDGALVSHEKIEEISLSLKHKAEPHSGSGKKSLGLKNIHDRLQMLYGSDYGIHVSRRIGRGFVVVASLPKIW